MSRDTSERDPAKTRPDRRRRHADDPSIPLSINLPLSIKERLDQAVVERRATRNALISQALKLWFEHQERAAEPDSGGRGQSSRELSSQSEQ